MAKPHIKIQINNVIILILILNVNYCIEIHY